MAVSTEEIRSMTAPDGRDNADHAYKIALAEFSAKFPPKTPEEIASMTAAEKYAYIVERCKKMPKRKPKTIEELQYQMRREMILQRMDQEDAASEAEFNLKISIIRAKAAAEAATEQFDRIQEEMKANHEAMVPVLQKHHDVETFETRKARIQKSQVSSFYNKFITHFEPMLDCYKKASQDFFVRKKKSFLDGVVGIMDFVKEHVPAPFNLAFTIFAGVAKYAADESAKRRFEKITEILPMTDQLSSLVRAVGLELSEHLFENYPELNEKDMVDLSKRAFVIATYTIYEVEKLNLNLEKATDQERITLLTDRIVNNVLQAPHFIALLEQRQKASHDVVKAMAHAETTPAFSTQKGQKVATAKQDHKQPSVLSRLLGTATKPAKLAAC